MNADATRTSIAGLVSQWRRLSAKAKLPLDVGLESRAADRSPPDLRQCLIDMLVAAAQLEFATIPPYLCALWSIENEVDPVADSIREVVQEEMLHLALVCNLLAAVGVQPQLRAWAPAYPAALPGQVHPSLTVWLQGLNKDSLEAFIQIESPESRSENVDFETGDPFWGGGDTIGVLYESILAAFRYLKPELKTDVQVTGPLSWRIVATLADVEWAIRIIQHQGEGAVIGPLDSGKADLAHYYRFLEIWKGKRLRFDAGDRRFHWRGRVQFPTCRPMGPVPAGGFEGPLPPVVARHLRNFDKHYHQMLIELENAWRPATEGVTTGQGALIRAYVHMFELGQPARALMAIPLGIPKGPTYGPQFTPPGARSTPPPLTRGQRAEGRLESRPVPETPTGEPRRRRGKHLS